MQVLRLIDHDNHAPSGASLLQQELVKFVVHADKILLMVFRTKLGEQEAHELAGSALRLKKKRRMRRATELLQQLKQQCCLAHTGLGNQRHEPASRLNPVIKTRQCL